MRIATTTANLILNLNKLNVSEVINEKCFCIVVFSFQEYYNPVIIGSINSFV